MIYDVTIIGAGPAGLTAAIYCGRNRLRTLVLSSNLGGQTAISGEVANYPGYNSISGIELINKMHQQATGTSSADIKIGTDYEITRLDYKDKEFSITTKGGETYKSSTVIITAGKNPKRLNIPGEKEFEGRGVSYCATCDGPFFKNKTVAVIGGGYSATEAVEMLIRNNATVFVLSISEGLDGEKITLENVKNSDKVTIVPFAHTTQILNDKSKVTGVEYRDGKTGETKQIKVDGIFIEIGSQPNTTHFEGLVNLNQWKEIEVDNKNSTKIPGLFAAGDVTNVWGKQIVIAAGEGAKAAMAVGEYLARQKGGPSA